jgi:hypothetical protein
MSSITTTFTLKSKSLFPNPMDISASAIDEINGEIELQSIVMNPSQKIEVFGPTLEADLSNTVYLYLQSPNTNSSNITIYLQDKNGTEIIIGLLHPSDFMWLPLAVYGSNVKVSCVNLDSKNTANVNLFWGHRS